MLEWLDTLDLNDFCSFFKHTAALIPQYFGLFILWIIMDHKCADEVS